MVPQTFKAVQHKDIPKKTRRKEHQKMTYSLTNCRKLLSAVAIALVLVSILAVTANIRPVFSQSQLLVDSEFNDSADSADLRANAPSQDWYDSRGGLSGGDPTLLTLDTANIGGDNTKKGALKSYGASTTRNAYLTQEFSSAQSGTFSVSFDIYIDNIGSNSPYNSVAPIYIGDNRATANAPTGTSDERFVFLSFYDSTPGSSGTDIQIRARTLSTQSYSDTSLWISVATGLSYKTWYRIKLTVNVAGGSYGVYVDGTFKSDVAKYSGYTNSSVYYMTFAADGDRRGDYYVDNVFSPAEETRTKVVSDSTQVIVGQEFNVYINVTNVVDLYGWEFQFDYDPSVLDLTYNATVAGGLNTPTNTFKDSVNETAGHLWWAVSTAYPTTTGITYSNHAIFEMHFNAIATGTSSLNLSGTILSNSHANPIFHTVVNSSVSVQTLDLRVTEVVICNMYGNETWAHSIYANDSYADLSTYYYPVNVTIENTGTLSAGSFKVKLEVYYDASLEASTELSVAGLAGSSTKELTFTSLFHPTKTGDAGRYSLKATVDSQNEIAEDDEGNNDKTKNDFMVTLMGDINGDKTVNILDGVKIALAWSGTPSDSQWNVAADLNHDNVINILDGTRISLHWGAHW